LHVTVDGEPIVDLWAGTADREQMRAWEANQLVNVWSTTKGWLALAMLHGIDRGLLDVDAPVAKYWPEFAANGKGSVRIKHLLTHTSGLPAPTVKVPDEALYDWAAMIDALERSTLWWEPGTRCGYHAATFGWLNGELVRRISGQSVGQYLRDHIAGPIGADVAIGLTDSEQARTVETLAPSAAGRLLFWLMFAIGGGPKSAAFTNPPRPFTAVNTRRWREAEIPSSNGHASARGLARLYTPLALGGAWNGVRLLSEAGVELAAREQIHMKDVVTGMDTRRTLGYMLPDSSMGDPRPLTAFGHPGMGGSLGFADPAHRLAFGYVMNQMIIGPDSRAMSLSRAVYRCLNR
jgi:CubicO group peptidase (beta-lactamase class C family)